MLKEFLYQPLEWRQNALTQTSARQKQQYDKHFKHDKDRKRAGQLMRVNHVGEVCAQALYIGQLLTAKESNLRTSLTQAKTEEIDHLVWCRDAMHRLNTKPSLIAGTWFSGALLLSIAFSLLGDEYNALFLEETEHQVGKHLERHLRIMPWADLTSIQILQQMLEEELEHADKARNFTTKQMHPFFQSLMALNGYIMTQLTQYI